MREIPLTQGMVALVDDEDYEEVMKHRWFAHRVRAGLTHYAVTNKPRSQGKGTIRMHVLLMGTDPDGRQVDHKNGNGCDNRRSNLRWATNAEQRMNSGPGSRNTTGFKGVSFDKARGKYEAKLKASDRHLHLGRFATAEEAARAYDRAARETFGDYARTNFEAE